MGASMKELVEPEQTPPPTPPIGLRWALPTAAALAILLHLVHGWLPQVAADTLWTWTRPTLWLLGSFLFWYRGRRPGESPGGWNWIALSCLLRGGGILVYATHPSPLLRLAFLDLAILAFAAGLLRWFDQGILWGGGVRRALDGVIVALAMLTVAFEALMHRVSAPGLAWYLLLHAAILFALLLGIATAQVLVDLRRMRGPLGWILLFLVMDLFSQILAVPMGSPGLHALLIRNPPTLILLTLMAPFARWTRDALTREEGRGQQFWGVLVVYVPFAAAVLWVLLSLRRAGPTHPMLVVLLCGLALAVAVRQIISMRDLASSCRLLQSQLDISTRSLKEHQGILQRNHQMNLLSALGAGLAHDFNNLLTVILHEVQVGRSEEAIGSVQKASALVRRLMDLTREGGGHMELFELGELLQARMKVFSRVCPRAIRVSLERGREECWMEADPLRIEQMMLNLVINARDAIPGAGAIRIRLDRQPDGRALVEVEDTGTGMEEAVRDKLFQPFFTTKAAGKGTGLGLSSVCAILESMGGTVEVATELGRGTTFRLRLPTVDLG